jgi:hypothetical protein
MDLASAAILRAADFGSLYLRWSNFSMVPLSYSFFVSLLYCSKGWQCLVPEEKSSNGLFCERRMKLSQFGTNPPKGISSPPF